MKYSTFGLLLTLLFFGLFLLVPTSEYRAASLFLSMYFVGVTLICLLIEDGMKNGTNP